MFEMEINFCKKIYLSQKEAVSGKFCLCLCGIACTKLIPCLLGRQLTTVRERGLRERLL